MKKAIVIGAFGCGNKGDDAILEGLYSVVESNWKLYPTQGHVGGLDKLLGQDVKPISLRLNEGFSFQVLASFIRFFFTYLMLLPRVDAVIIGGGSLLHDLTSYNLPFYYLLQDIAGIFKTSVYYIGVGAGPINRPGSARRLIKHLDRADCAIIRDPEDYSLLQSFGARKVVLSADNAFATGAIGRELTTIQSKPIGISKGEYIVVTACEWFESENFWNKNSLNFDKQIQALKESVIKLHNITNKKILFLPTVMHDYELGKILMKCLNADYFILSSDNYDCREMATIVENSFFVFGMRMHSLIFAIRGGIPFIAIIYDQKVRHLVRRLNLEEYLLEVSDMGSNRVEEKVKELLSNYDSISFRLKNSGQEMESMARTNICSILTKETGYDKDM